MFKKIFVISGHGDGDKGAISNGFNEAERVRLLATKIKEYGGDNVVLCDFNINAYKSNVIGKGLVPKDCAILELHLDSSTNNAAKGGHIIISSNFEPDKYDKALEKVLVNRFAGRSQTIVRRSDIANANRAKAKGYNYRLIECCFISNFDDMKKFNAEIDNFAKDILRCFDIAEKTKKSYVDIKVERLQKGSKGKAVTILQILLNNNGYKFIPDGVFGEKTLAAVKDFQKKNGTGVDGIVGVKTWTKLLGE